MLRCDVQPSHGHLVQLLVLALRPILGWAIQRAGPSEHRGDALDRTAVDENGKRRELALLLVSRNGHDATILILCKVPIYFLYCQETG